MMFREVIGLVGSSWFPVDEKLALADSVADPIETHIHSFGTFLFDIIGGDTYCSGVVGLERCRRLRMPQFFQRNSQWDRGLAVVEERSQFGFRSAG